MKSRFLISNRSKNNKNGGDKMKFNNIIYEVEGNIAWITLNRPIVFNILNVAMYKELVQAIELAENDDNVRVVVFTGAGKGFCGGQDILEMPVVKEGMDQGLNYIKATLDGLDKIEHCEKPTIAAVNGAAMGGGTEITLLCDLVIASKDATFGLPEGTLGIAPGTAVSKIQKVMPKHFALEMMLTGDIFDAKQAEAMGLVNKVVPAEGLKKAVKMMASKIIRLAPRSAKYIKKLWHEAPSTWDYWYTIMPSLLLSQDATEGIKSFMEKRKPNWKEK